MSTGSCTQHFARALTSHNDAVLRLSAVAAGTQAAPNPELSASKEKPQKQALFHDDTLPSFFRRLAWSPDGATPTCCSYLAMGLKP